MKLKLTLTKKEIDSLMAVIGQASANAEVMVSDGRQGGQLKDAAQLEAGCKLIQDIISLGEP